MTETYARRAASLNAGTLEFLAYSSNGLAGRHHTAIMMKWHPAPETADVVSS